MIKNSIGDHIGHLSKDKKLKVLIESQPPFILQKRKKVYLRLCSSILSQQLSTTVAKVLYNRFLELFDGKEPTAQQIIDTPAETFRGIGFSNAKASYVHNVCRFFIENKITDAQLYKMNNEDVIALLTQIKGVGKWTVEMILMFTLGREDVFAMDDLGLKQGVIKLYGIKETEKKLLMQKIEKISLKWSPYRTYASRYLWNWKDNPPDL
ncbi:DNA-3-methyladenine glycosylase 2 family protein [Hanamia caeni]|uniref:DNA-3-methyladenine glycosylase II n=1 Tax=Hanamia caeni TaxID=2294116 RepID=A0A3M9NEQ0_9BACT|nr:DNA-3-methyladenine glycosylase [Hanamia caeni]RNI36280.1 DNA-3-methyladenine glycosylase 2 family protein [Hanamia caeni]